MEIIKVGKTNYQTALKTAADVLSNDGLVVFPSDTVYGLAANALSKRAVRKLFRFKDRPLNQSVSVALKNLEGAKKYVDISPQQAKVLSTLLPGPYTVILSAKHKTVTDLEAEDGTLGIRIPDYRLTRELSAITDFPYTATSANLHHRPPHHSVTALLNTLSDKKKALIDLILDYGTLPPNRPSTVINLTQSTASTLRQGDYGFSEVLRVETNSDRETRQLAQKLIEKYQTDLEYGALVFVLQGDLGAGKTVFAKGLGEALGIINIVSPTFVIYYEYKSKETSFHHFDLYRIENNRDLDIFELDQMLDPGNVVAFEWGERIGSVFSLLRQKKAKVIMVNLTDLKNNRRQLTVYEL